LATETADAETSATLNVGTIFVAGNRYNGGTLQFEERWAGKYALGLGLTTNWECPDIEDCKRGEGSKNQFILAQRIFEYRRFEAGFGISYWVNTTPSWNSHTPWALLLGWNFTDKFAVRYYHFSTNGASPSNGGLDLPLGWTWKF
jgi:hypothetical protein